MGDHPGIPWCCIHFLFAEFFLRFHFLPSRRPGLKREGEERRGRKLQVHLKRTYTGLETNHRSSCKLLLRGCKQGTLSIKRYVWWLCACCCFPSIPSIHPPHPLLQRGYPAASIVACIWQRRLHRWRLRDAHMHHMTCLQAKKMLTRPARTPLRLGPS